MTDVSPRGDFQLAGGHSAKDHLTRLEEVEESATTQPKVLYSAKRFSPNSSWNGQTNQQTLVQSLESQEASFSLALRDSRSLVRKSPEVTSSSPLWY